MGNTGRKIILQLKEVYVIGGSETGNTKPNVVGDPDYIAPVNNASECPVTTTLTCPYIIASKRAFNGTNYGIQYEFSLPTSVINNTAIDKIRLNFCVGGNPASSAAIHDLSLQGYTSGEAIIAATGTYSIYVTYIDAALAVVHDCGNVVNNIIVS